jgi:hypothetical protein
LALVCRAACKANSIPDPNHLDGSWRFPKCRAEVEDCSLPTRRDRVRAWFKFIYSLITSRLAVCLAIALVPSLFASHRFISYRQLGARVPCSSSTGEWRAAESVVGSSTILISKFQHIPYFYIPWGGSRYKR